MAARYVELAANLKAKPAANLAATRIAFQHSTHIVIETTSVAASGRRRIGKLGRYHRQERTKSPCVNQLHAGQQHK